MPVRYPSLLTPMFEPRPDTPHRLGMPSDMAGLALFLASPAGRAALACIRRPDSLRVDLARLYINVHPEQVLKDRAGC